jgi:hypothetical protein
MEGDWYNRGSYECWTIRGKSLDGLIHGKDAGGGPGGEIINKMPGDFLNQTKLIGS